MILNLLRRCYTTKARYFRDDLGREEEIIWQWCGKDAKPLPFPHAFGSGVWDVKHGYDDGKIGEIRSRPITYLDGNTYPRLPGKCAIGTKEQWLRGIKLTDPVIRKNECNLPSVYEYNSTITLVFRSTNVTTRKVPIVYSRTVTPGQLVFRSTPPTITLIGTGSRFILIGWIFATIRPILEGDGSAELTLEVYGDATIRPTLEGDGSAELTLEVHGDATIQPILIGYGLDVLPPETGPIFSRSVSAGDIIVESTTATYVPKLAIHHYTLGSGDIIVESTTAMYVPKLAIHRYTLGSGDIVIESTNATATLKASIHHYTLGSGDIIIESTNATATVKHSLTHLTLGAGDIVLESTNPTVNFIPG